MTKNCDADFEAPLPATTTAADCEEIGSQPASSQTDDLDKMLEQARRSRPSSFPSTSEAPKPMTLAYEFYNYLKDNPDQIWELGCAPGEEAAKAVRLIMRPQTPKEVKTCEDWSISLTTARREKISAADFPAWANTMTTIKISITEKQTLDYQVPRIVAEAVFKAVQFDVEITSTFRKVAQILARQEF